MENFQQGLDMVLGALIAIWVAFMGALTRALHEHAHGIPITWIRIISLIPAAVIMGELGHVIGSYLVTTYSFPPSTDHALAGVLGYLGPTLINEVFSILLQHFKDRLKGKPADGTEDSTKGGK